MVARNFGGQELPPYVRLLQDDLLALEDSMKQQQMSNHAPQAQQHVYFDLSELPESACTTSMYLGPEIASAQAVTKVTLGDHLGVPSSSSTCLLMEPQQSADTCSVTSSRCGTGPPSLHGVLTNSSRKRKASFTDVSDGDEDAFTDDSKMPRSVEDSSKKQNHSEIEKRRRDKMNTYITELSTMVPMCHAMSRKLDKLTVLRMAVQHLKTIRGAVHSYTEGHYKPAFLSDEELKHLILQGSITMKCRNRMSSIHARPIRDSLFLHTSDKSRDSDWSRVYNMLMQNAAEGFLFVVGCDRGRILYVSETVAQVLNYSQGDLLGQSWFDILHPKDVAKVKEQLSSSDLSPRERLIDAKTMLPVKTDMPQGVSRLCPGARRSFFCRMKCKMSNQVKEEADTTNNSATSASCHRRKKSQSSDRRYSVIQCTGYLKSWAPAKMGLEEPDGEDGESASHLSCLVAVGRVQLPPCNSLAISDAPPHAPPNLRTIEFVSRHALDGKFLFVDQRATLVLGFLPQELLGTSMYEYYFHEDIPHLADSHKAALQSSDRVTTQTYRFRSKDGSYIRLQSEWRAFCNPWTRDVEYLVAKNCLVRIPTTLVEQHPPPPAPATNFDNYFAQTNGSPGGREMSRLISSHVEASKIGRQIAEAALDTRRRGGVSGNGVHCIAGGGDSSSMSSSPSPGLELSQSSLQIMGNGGDILSNSYASSISRSNSAALTRHSSHNVSLCGENSSEKDEEELLLRDMMAPVASIVPPPSVSPPNGPSPSHEHSTTSNDGNDEAAMAVIMSLLEADAGLGGPVDFSGLPWPLP